MSCFKHPATVRIATGANAEYIAKFCDDCAKKIIVGLYKKLAKIPNPLPVYIDHIQ
jgi:hypothetical protein